MKNSHQNEEKLVEKDLNEQEMRRLKKIHTVEEAQCMLKVLHAAKNWSCCMILLYTYHSYFFFLQRV